MVIVCVIVGIIFVVVVYSMLIIPNDVDTVVAVVCIDYFIFVFVVVCCKSVKFYVWFKNDTIQ